MRAGHNTPETIILSGDPLTRIRGALAAARSQVQAGQHLVDGRRIEDALVEAEEALGDVLARINGAVEDDKAEAEESGDAARRRSAWFPRYHAA